ncbi:hypothetical protein IWQ56_000911, partial [Coemansia nantahalensis]
MKQGCRTFQERRDTFLRRGRFRWPYLKYSSYLAQPDTLASAGFVFGPAKDAPDNVQCFHCGFELTGWEATDDPFAEHHSHQPGCAYARLHCQTRTAVVFCYPLELHESLASIDELLCDNDLSDSSQDIDTPCKNSAKRRKCKPSDDERECSTPTVTRTGGSSLKRRECSDSDQVVLDETPTKRSRLLGDDQWTPVRHMQSLRPSGSPTRVSGSKVVASVKFTNLSRRELCKVDKTLVCKGFWDSIEEAGRICLPRRSGKTYNLTQLLLFFSSAPEHAVLEEIPDDILLNGMHSPAEIRAMDIATKCRYKREALFDGSLLQTMHPAFFNEHFMKHPVVHINLSKCKGVSLGEFVINLCCVFADVIEKLVADAQYGTAEQTTCQPDLDHLGRLHKLCKTAVEGSDDSGLQFKGLALRMFEAVSQYVRKRYGRYILLIDEHDIPFITIRLANWSNDDKGAAWGILKLLFQTMLKDNHGLLKGLLVGVFEIPLTEMGSGANNVKDIRLVPAEENDIQSSILSAARPHSGSGLDALTDSFWFNANEVGLMLDNSAERCPKIRAHKDYIMTTIREWYNGYYIGRFRGKYNPWSVSSFIESLCNLLDNCDDDPVRVRGMIKSAARPYWVTTGTTGLIDAQIERHRVQFIPLAKRLIRNFEDDRREECCSSPPAPTPGSAARARGQLGASRNVPLVSTRVNLAAFDNDRFSEPGLLTLCLYAGYLTRQQSTSVCIPNYEVYEVWLQLFARAVMGAEMADNSSNCERGALLKELWCGKTDQLCKLATSSHG